MRADPSATKSEKDQARGKPGECRVPEASKAIKRRSKEGLEVTTGLTTCVAIITVARAVWRG